MANLDLIAVYLRDSKPAEKFVVLGEWALSVFAANIVSEQ